MGVTREPSDNPALREGTFVGLADRTTLIARNGRECPIDDSVAPIRDGSGAVVRAVLVFRNIAGRKRAEEELRQAAERTRSILEAVSDGFYSLDCDWRFVCLNPQAERLMNRPRRAVAGQIRLVGIPRGSRGDFDTFYHLAMNGTERAASASSRSGCASSRNASRSPSKPPT